LQQRAVVYLVIMLIVNDVFIKFTIMKLKYILTTFLVEYSTFRVYVLSIIKLLQPKS